MRKKYRLLFLCVLVLLSLTGIGQEYPSAHQLDYEKYKNLPRHPSFFDVKGEGIIPFKKINKKTPTVAVFGYLPYWEYPQSLPYLQYDLLSHLAVFDFSVDANGNITPPSYWPWTDLINAAHRNGVKVIMTAVNFSGYQIHDILTDPQIKANFFEQAKNVLLTYKLQGVNIDFENVRSADRGVVLNGFLSDLHTTLQEALPDAELSFAAPPINWGSWNFEGLAQTCDYILIMEYDFYGPWSETSGPCAPLTGGTYNTTRSLTVDFGAVTQDSPEKLILGVPYYGNRWETGSGEAYASVVKHLNQPTYANAINWAQSHEQLWDDGSKTSWSRDYSNNNWVQLWYDSDQSLALKYQLADVYHLKGVGMWALGYDNGRSELWNLLRARYGEPQSVNNANRTDFDVRVIKPKSGGLRLLYHLPKWQKVSLWVFDLTGRLIYRSIPKDQSAGLHFFHIPVGTFPQDFYLYQLKIGTQRFSGKF